MSKRKPDPRGVMAIALFEIAVALERWAAAQERIAESNEILREIAHQDLAFRKHGAETFLAQSQATIDDLAAEARASLDPQAITVDALAAALVASGNVYQPTDCVECGYGRKSGRHLTPPGCDKDPCPDPMEHHTYIAPSPSGIEEAKALLLALKEEES